MNKTIIYKNRTFTLGTKGRYYFGRVKGKNWSLHRYKYTIERGDIPEGWHIHHIDGDCFNNDIDNLEPIDPKKHSDLHPPSEDTLKKWQEAGIEKAPEWHGSEEGIEWHKKHYEDNVKSKFHERVSAVCSFCSADTMTAKSILAKKGNIFCSNKCKSAWRRKNKPDKKMVICPTCSTEFETLKYLPNMYCSLKCKPTPNPLGYYSRKNL